MVTKKSSNDVSKDSKPLLNSKVLSFGILSVACVVVAIVTYVMYTYTQGLLHERLKERLEAITATASLQFTDSEMRNLYDVALQKQDETIYDPLYKNVNKKLQEIRSTNDDIKYVYLFGKTNDPNTLIFLADADVNEDLILEEGDEGNDFPGSEYDVSEIYALQADAFNAATTDDELYEDEWGQTLSGYAPILSNSESGSVATLGIDIDASNYIHIVNSTFKPFVWFIILLLILLVSMIFVLVRTWEGRVNVFKELDRQKDELLSIVSHQLATPISSVKWYLEMMLDGDVGKLNKEQTEHVTTMTTVAATLSDLVSMILDVSRLQLGKMKVDRSEIDLNEFFNEVISTIDPKAKEQGVEFVKKLPKKMPIALFDRRLMRMTLENLLSNAVKYTPKGGKVNLDVSIKNNTLYYTVKDTGCGIPKSEHGKMFQKLYRATNVRDVNGNGFGLYVAKGAVESQGGEIGFVSTEGKGTTFDVQLPILRPTKG